MIPYATIIKIISNKYVVGLGAAVFLILGIILYGSVKYDNGYSDRNLLCVQEKADIEKERQKDALAKRKQYEKIDNRPRLGSNAILERMRRNDL